MHCKQFSYMEYQTESTLAEIFVSAAMFIRKIFLIGFPKIQKHCKSKYCYVQEKIFNSRNIFGGSLFFKKYNWFQKDGSTAAIIIMKLRQIVFEIL